METRDCNREAVGAPESAAQSKDLEISVRRTLSRIESKNLHGFLPTRPSLWRSTLACVGVVFGDVGTSPLYTLTECVNLLPEITESAVIGVVSLVVWSLIVVVCVKYLVLVLRCDHDGEGGIFSLLQMTGKSEHPVFLAAAVIGGASMIGDSLITPALSVLSAVEGLKDERIFGWSSEAGVVSITCVILFFLYAFQYKGTSKIGVAFGPIVTLYFLSIAAVGIYNIAVASDRPIYKALSPYTGLAFLFSHGVVGFRVLSAVVLCVTGAEAVSADLGHFSKPPIWLSWYSLVFPALVLNYLGQGAFLLDSLEVSGQWPRENSSVFFRSTPTAVYVPVWIIATLATVVASQAMITGCFSLVSQGISLGLFPRLRTLNTDPDQRAQIFIPSVTLLLGLGTIGLVLVFRKSSQLAGAYGISVLVTFVMTDLVLTGALAGKMKSWMYATAVVLPFAVVDWTFLSANVYEKMAHGGWLPLAIGALLVLVMVSWRSGRVATMKVREEKSEHQGVKLDELLLEIAERKIVRNSGISGVFLSPFWKQDTVILPSSFLVFKNVTHSVPEVSVFLTICFDKTRPFLADTERSEHLDLGAGLFALKLSFGYAESVGNANLHTRLVTFLNSQNCPLDADNLWFFVHAETVKASVSRRIWSKALIAFYVVLLEISASAADFFGLPAEKVVHLGNTVSL